MAPNDPHPKAPRMIAVSSGKGGVGKSTVTANIAVAMTEAGLRVGIVDADIYGPSIPGILGVPAGKPAMTPGGMIEPAMAHGIRVISMGMLTDDDSPAILRGPMVTKYLQSFVRQVDWGDTQVLLLDLPPGTGDIQLTLAQAFPLAGAVVVSTPQDVSLKIARRGLRMMEQVKVPILGVIENMSGFTCPSCGTLTHIFHQGGGEAIAQELGVPFLGKVPLDPAVVDCGDDGVPLLKAAPDGPAAAAYRRIAAALAGADADAAGIATPFRWTVTEADGKPAPAPVSPDGPADRLAALEHAPGRLTLTWTDGTTQTLGARDLRIACPCAKCRDEMTGARLLDPATVAFDIDLTRIWSVGNYALGMAFSDGHDTGIYTLKSLRAMASTAMEDV
ncbi:MAG: P-loop NTPase [Rhodobacteraceae bacterium]|nr:P-loop NTPase [Paracoccaceae bacterium]